MKVRDIVARKAVPVLTVNMNLDVGAAAGLLARHRVGALPAVEAGVLHGIVAESDIVAALAKYGTVAPGVSLKEVMRRAPVCQLDDELPAIMIRMTRERLRHLVVLDGDTLAGIISVGDIVKHRLDELETERGVLRDLVAAQRAT